MLQYTCTYTCVHVYTCTRSMLSMLQYQKFIAIHVATPAYTCTIRTRVYSSMDTCTGIAIYCNIAARSRRMPYGEGNNLHSIAPLEMHGPACNTRRSHFWLSPQLLSSTVTTHLHSLEHTGSSTYISVQTLTNKSF